MGWFVCLYVYLSVNQLLLLVFYCYICGREKTTNCSDWRLNKMHGYAVFVAFEYDACLIKRMHMFSYTRRKCSEICWQPHLYYYRFVGRAADFMRQICGFQKSCMGLNEVIGRINHSENVFIMSLWCALLNESNELFVVSTFCMFFALP